MRQRRAVLWISLLPPALEGTRKRQRIGMLKTSACGQALGQTTDPAPPLQEIAQIARRRLTLDVRSKCEDHLFHTIVLDPSDQPGDAKVIRSHVVEG